MNVILEHRWQTVFLCGLIVALTALFAPPAAWGDGPPCEEPYVDHCLMSLENCISCENFCSEMFLEEDCEIEEEFCDEDEAYCNPEGMFPYYEMCSCKVEGPS